MNHTIEIQNTKIEYEHKVNRKLRTIRLTIHPGGRVVVSSPAFVSQDLINKFIARKSNWITKKVEHYKLIPTYNAEENARDFNKYKTAALDVAIERLEFFNRFYKFNYNKVSIKNSKSLWGSCSKKGNLNFNYKISLLPQYQLDYIIVHELCHLKEFNHSSKFWELVEKTVPNHRLIRKEIKKLGLNFS